MRKCPFVLLALLAASGAGGPACAASLVLPTSQPVQNDASQPAGQFWAAQRPAPQLIDRPVGELIATRLGLAEGSAELFRYRLENAPSNATVLDGVVDGGGIKLKLTW